MPLMLALMRIADIIGKFLRAALSIRLSQDSSPEDPGDLQNGAHLANSLFSAASALQNYIWCPEQMVVQPCLK